MLGKKKKLVPGVGVEFDARLIRRKLLILLNGKNAKNAEFAEVRYTAGTRHSNDRILTVWFAKFRPAGSLLP